MSGTAAHSWTLAFGSEPEAFRAQYALYGKDAVLLVDTYDTMQGVENAIAVAPRDLGGIRLDSGDLEHLSKRARARLDESGLSSTRIVASGDLDEYQIAELRTAGAPIDAWGVGTRLVRSVDAPHLGGVYKLVFHDEAGEPRMKTSPGKGTRPGAHQVFRVFRDGLMHHDVLALADERAPDAEPLLFPVLTDGSLVGAVPSLDETRARLCAQVAALPPALRTIDGETEPYPVRLSDALRRLMRRTPTGEASA